MNSKNIVALKDKTLCMKCLTKPAFHFYPLYGRGYGSRYDGSDTKFQCCEECNQPEYQTWFTEDPVFEEEYCEKYKHEDDIDALIKSLPLEAQELFCNTFDEADGWFMEAQDWIDYQLGELPHEKCKEYNMFSPDDIEAYRDRFPVCEHVVNVLWEDGSQASRCPFGACGKYNQKCESVSDNCTNCPHFKKREVPIREISREDIKDWKIWAEYNIRKDELKKKFE